MYMLFTVGLEKNMQAATLETSEILLSASLLAILELHIVSGLNLRL